MNRFLFQGTQVPLQFYTVPLQKLLLLFEKGIKGEINTCQKYANKHKKSILLAPSTFLIGFKLSFDL